MIKTYEEFIEKMQNRIKAGDDFYYNLLKNIINNPYRYTGIFRLSNAKTKLIQNTTQSIEIKFGDFMEDIITEYIGAMGYSNLDKNFGAASGNAKLNADQHFSRDNNIYLIEQKIRDDHDSTKKRGQYDNFRKKYKLLKETYPNKNITAIMWFIDDALTKNYRYYKSEASAETIDNVNVEICYGKSLFENIFKRLDVWEEITEYLKRNKIERSQELIYIPDFDTSDEILKALRKLKKEERRLFTKLTSNVEPYIQLRAELFETGTNLSRV